MPGAKGFISCRAPSEEGIRAHPRCQCGPCDLNSLCDSLCDLNAGLFGVVLPLKPERKNGLRTFVKDVEAISPVGHAHDIAHRAVLVAEARQLFGLLKQSAASRGPLKACEATSPDG